MLTEEDEMPNCSECDCETTMQEAQFIDLLRQWEIDSRSVDDAPVCPGVDGYHP
jgi:hypothetical protein